MTEQGTDSTPGVAKQAVRNTAWAYATFVFGKGLTFVSTIILSQFLTPAEFGVVGYCLIALGYLDLLNDVGVGHALIARKDRLEEASNAAFAIGLGTSLALFAGSWLAAPLIAWFFREPQVVDLLRAISTVIIISAFGIVPGALIQRDLRFKARMLPELGSTLIKGAVSVALAWQGVGPWSLVWGQVAGQVFATVSAFVLVRWRPTRRFDRQVSREVLRFGLNVTFSGLLGSFMTNVDYLLVGRIMGSAALGHYTMAYRIPELIIRQTNYAVGKVAYPLLAKIQSDAAQLRSLYFAYVRYVALFTVPAGFGIALVAPAFMRTFFPPVWEPAIVPMQLVAVAIGLSVVSRTPGVIYNAINRPEIVSNLSLVKLPLVLATLGAGTLWGISGVAAGHIALTLICMVLDTVVAGRIVKFNPVEVVWALAPTLAGSAALWFAGSAAAAVLPPSGILTMLALTAVGTAAYLAVLAVTSRDVLVQASTALRTSLARS